MLSNPTLRRYLAILALLTCAAVFWSCNLLGSKPEAEAHLSLADSLKAYDSLQIFFLSPSRDTLERLFHGKYSDSGQVAHIPLHNYHGGQAIFLIRAFRGGHLAWIREAPYDGQQLGPTTFSALPDDTLHNIGGDSLTITLEDSGRGTIQPMADLGRYRVRRGSDVAFRVQADSGFHIQSLQVDGAEDSAGRIAGVHGFRNVQADHGLRAVFAPNRYRLQVNAKPGGSVSADPAQAGYDLGQKVRLKARPGSGYRFTGWSDDARGSADTTTLVMDGDKVATANFAPLGSYTLNLTASHGSVSKAPDKADYHAGDTVRLVAAPDPGYAFAGWDGDRSDTASGITIIIDDNKSLIARFRALTFTIQASAGAGGTINPSGAVAATYGSNSTFLIAPAQGNHVSQVKVDGAVVDSIGSYTFYAIKGDHGIEASFAADLLGLTIQNDGHGSTTPAGVQSLAKGAALDINAIPAQGYGFFNWSVVNGQVTFADASQAKTKVTVNSASATIRANFRADTYTLALPAATGGSVTKAPDKAGYNLGDTVSLKAVPQAGYNFTGWSGDSSGTANPLIVVIRGNTSVTANFAIKTFALTVQASGGTVAKSPDKALYNYGDKVQLTANPTDPANYEFTGWSGDLGGTDNPALITMDETKTVTAGFRIKPPSGLNYGFDSLLCIQDLAIQPLAPKLVGGPVSRFSVSPSLPAGISLNATTGVISGALSEDSTMPMAASTYTITAENTSGITACKLVVSGHEFELLGPKGGEAEHIGDTLHIRWRISPTTDISIYLSLNGGASWQLVGGGVNNADSNGMGDYSWVIPSAYIGVPTVSNAAIIKITDVFNRNIQSSSGQFSIRNR